MKRRLSAFVVVAAVAVGSLAVSVGARPGGAQEVKSRAAAIAATTQPSLTISPPSGATVSGEVTVRATPTNAAAVSQIYFYLDSTFEGTSLSAPYAFSFNAGALAPGTHVIKAYMSYSLGSLEADSEVATASTGTTAVPPKSTTTVPTPPPASTRAVSNPPPAGRPFVGLNAYELATDYGVNNGCGSDIHTSTDAFFASLPTGTVVRFWATQPFGTASANAPNPGSLTWGPLDNVFATAAKYGDKLLPVLGNQWGDCDGVNEAPGVRLGHAFYSGGYRSNTSEGPLPYWQWVNDIVARYASSPAVYAWEPINEPQVCDVTEAQATTDLTSFFTAVGGEIHALAPGSKVESGFFGTGTCGLENGDYQTVGASPGLDILTYHDYYAATAAVGGDQYNGIAVRVAQAKALGKPIIAGEMGIEAGTSCSVSLTQRAADFSAKISAQSALGVTGFMFWDWYPAPTSSCVYENMQAGDPALALLTG